MEIISRKEAKSLGRKRYFTNKKCKHGHLAERYVSDSHCISCTRVRTDRHRKENRELFEETRNKYHERTKKYRAERDRKYREDNIDKVKEREKRYREDNIERFRERDKDYYWSNREAKLKYSKEYNKKNRSKLNEKSRHKYSTNEDIRLATHMRHALRRTLKLMGSCKEGQTFDIVGYTPKKLRESIESKFLEGMSWDNYGDWHIDHKIPIHFYIQRGGDSPKEINSLDNLIPMWASDNLSKGTQSLSDWLETKGENSLEYKMYSKFI